MVLKLDLEKACDWLECHFVEVTPRDASLQANLINTITGLLHRSSCCLLWNGEAIDMIKLSRGLRQGNPLSPYFFVLCMERPSHRIISKVEDGEWRPLRVSRGGIKISHLFFANYLILFVDVGDDQIACIKKDWRAYAEHLVRVLILINL